MRRSHVEDYKESAAYKYQLRILESEHAEERLIPNEKACEDFDARTAHNRHARLRRFHEVLFGGVYGGR